MSDVRQTRWGYVDSRGETAIAFEFEHAFRFREGKGRVCAGERIGFISSDGTFVIPPLYSKKTGTFSEGRASAQLESGLIGYINDAGEFVIAPAFDLAYPFCEGLACVRTAQDDGNGRYGFIDSAGHWAIPATFERPNNFSDGLTATYVDGEYRFMDKTGCLLERGFLAAGAFDSGFAPVESPEGWGIVDRDMSFRLLDVDFIFSGSSGRFLVVKDGSDSIARYGFVDCQCNYIFPPILDEALTFAGDLAAAKVNGRWGFIDASGSWAIEPTFTKAGNFSGGLAQVVADQIVSYIDKCGRRAFDMNGFVAFDFEEGLSPAYLV